MKAEREIFEEWYEGHHNGRKVYCDYIDEEKSYSSGYINTLWIGWKASANREDYKLVPVEPTLKMSIAYEKNSIAPISSLSVCGYKAMIGVLE